MRGGPVIFLYVFPYTSSGKVGNGHPNNPRSALCTLWWAATSHCHQKSLKQLGSWLVETQRPQYLDKLCVWGAQLDSAAASCTVCTLQSTERSFKQEILSVDITHVPCISLYIPVYNAIHANIWSWRLLFHANDMRKEIKLRGYLLQSVSLGFEVWEVWSLLYQLYHLLHVWATPLEQVHVACSLELVLLPKIIKVEGILRVRFTSPTATSISDHALHVLRNCQR